MTSGRWTMAVRRGERITRRRFITTGVAGSLLVPVFLDDLGAAFANAGQKPVLTIASLNAFFREMHAAGPAHAASFYREAQDNLEGFLLNHFTINPRQLAVFREAVRLRGPGLRRFIQGGLQTLESGKAVPPPVASFDPKLSPFVRIQGFGQVIATCGNQRIGVLQPSPTMGLQGIQCANFPPESPTHQPVQNCAYVYDCVSATAVPRAC
jgi:hypothetical protein